MVYFRLTTWCSDLCSDFYTDDEVEQARLLMAKVLPSKRFGKPRGAAKDVVNRTLSALLKICLNPHVELPTFCVVHVTRLPPVDIHHIDMSAVLLELQQLHAEVRAVNCIRDEVAVLRQELVELKQSKIEMMVRHSSHVNRVSGELDFPPLPKPENANGTQLPGAGADDIAAKYQAAQAKKFSDHARGLQAAGIRQQQPKRRHPPVVGSSASNNVVKAVATQRIIDVFVSRLHPMTTVSELQDCINVIKGDSLSVHDVKCEKLNARYEHLYSSFRVQLRVDSSDMKCALELFMANESWPNGVFVRRYFPPEAARWLIRRIKVVYVCHRLTVAR